MCVCVCVCVFACVNRVLVVCVWYKLHIQDNMERNKGCHGNEINHSDEVILMVPW